MNERPGFEEVAELLRAAGADKLPGHLDLELVEIAEGTAEMRCELKPFHSAPNGYLHAASIIALADTCAGYGCVGNFPEGATGFTTIELKTNFFGTLMEGALHATAKMVHGGKTTQVWDAEVKAEATGKTLALFRCTQLILYPRP
ncbi:MAG: PaaI family thioesterase [Actinobacteria bacterium]|nr:MAG: PaaI family thioesterase [Actinomycetota bacterium]REK33549.1 MAG: PaaI family thioesterase [Actinomycetota bacterium]